MADLDAQNDLWQVSFSRTGLLLTIGQNEYVIDPSEAEWRLHRFSHQNLYHLGLVEKHSEALDKFVPAEMSADVEMIYKERE